MSILKIPLQYEGSKDEAVIYTLLDSSASFSCITPECAEMLANPEKMRRSLEVATATSGNYLRSEYRVALDFYYDKIRMSDESMVIPGLSEDAILGANTLQKWRIKLDFENDTIIVDPKVAKAIFK